MPRRFTDLINVDEKILESSFVVPAECLGEVAASVRAAGPVLTLHLIRPRGGRFSILFLLFPEIPMLMRSWLRGLFTRPATRPIR